MYCPREGHRSRILCKELYPPPIETRIYIPLHWFLRGCWVTQGFLWECTWEVDLRNKDKKQKGALFLKKLQFQKSNKHLNAQKYIFHYSILTYKIHGFADTLSRRSFSAIWRGKMLLCVISREITKIHAPGHILEHGTIPWRGAIRHDTVTCFDRICWLVYLHSVIIRTFCGA